MPVLTIAMLFAATIALASASTDSARLPDTMRAAAIDKGGGPDVLSIHHLPVPKPKTGEVLIAVRAAGVGVWETEFRQHPLDGAQFPLVLGSDGAGTVVAIGSGVRGFKVGDLVYGTSGAFYAEFVTVPAENISPIPKGIGVTEAGGPRNQWTLRAPRDRRRSAVEGQETR